MYGGVVRIEAHASPSLSRDQLWGCLGVSELYFLAELFCPSTAALWDGGLLTNDTLHPSHALPLSAILVLSTLYIAYTKYRYVLPLQPLAFSESVRPLRNVIYWEAWINAWKMNKRHTYTKGSPALWSSLSMVYNKAKWLLKTRQFLWKHQTLLFLSLIIRKRHTHFPARESRALFGSQRWSDTESTGRMSRWQTQILHSLFAERKMFISIFIVKRELLPHGWRTTKQFFLWHPVDHTCAHYHISWTNRVNDRPSWCPHK